MAVSTHIVGNVFVNTVKLMIAGFLKVRGETVSVWSVLVSVNST